MNAPNGIVKVLSGPAGWALAIATGGIVLYFVYNRIKKDTGAAAGAIASGVAKPIADFYSWLTVPAPINVLGQIVFPDGSAISPNNVSIKWDGNQGYFVLEGTKFLLSSHDANGNYPATPAGAAQTVDTRKQLIGDNYYDTGLLQ